MANQEDKKHYFRDFWQFVKPYRAPLRTVYILYFLNAALNLLPAMSIRFYIDSILQGESAKVFWFSLPPVTGNITDKVFASLIFMLSVLFIIIVANIIGVMMWRLGTKSVEKVMYDIKIKIHNHINKLSLGYFNSERTGTVMTKAVGDVNNLSMFLGNSFTMLYTLVQLVMAPFLMLSLSPLLFLIALIPAPFIIIAIYNIRYKLKPLYQEQRENESMINSQIQEVISGIREVKAFNMEEKSEKKYSDINYKFYEVQNRIMRIFSFNHQLQYGAKDLGVVLVAVLGGTFMLLGKGGITVGMIASFVALVGFLYNPISQILGFFNVIQRGMVSLERIIDFINVEHDVKDKRGAKILKPSDVKGVIEYNNVSFSYDKTKPVLQNINLSVEKGEQIAIVGESGGGKSTMLSLLLRFYDAGEGSVLIDGVDVKDVTQRSLRENVGIVFQETFLFYGTIADNLLYINPGKTWEDMVEACRAANILDTINAFPDKFDTKVGERGVTLSGGQKQRLAIARVFLKDPAIVILDEATSAVDTATESAIQASIDRMLEGRTSFIIAHRLSTIQKCDRIVVLSGGTIAEVGTHDELMEKKGIFYNLQQKNG